jgi:hypothetical protein
MQHVWMSHQIIGGPHRAVTCGVLMSPECYALNKLRLDRDWSFRTLAGKMKQAGVPIPWRTLNYLLTHEDMQVRVRDRTEHKLRKFLAYAKAKRWITERDWNEGAPELRSHDIAPSGRRRRAAAASLRSESVPGR